MPKPTYEYFFTWACHYCGMAGMTTEINPKCPECSHIWCDNCRLEKHKKRVSRETTRRSSQSMRSQPTAIGQPWPSQWMESQLSTMDSASQSQSSKAEEHQLTPVDSAPRLLESPPITVDDPNRTSKFNEHHTNILDSPIYRDLKPQNEQPQPIDKESANVSWLSRVRPRIHYAWRTGLIATVSILWAPKPLKSGTTRVEWTCQCGHSGFDDFIELKPDGIERLLKAINHSPGTSANSGGSFGIVGKTVSGALDGLRSALRARSSATEDGLPLHERAATTIQPGNNPSSSSGTAPAEPSFLLLCHREGRHGTKLLQLNLLLENATSDSSLFKILRRYYHSIHNPWNSYLSLRCVQSIRFVHFELYGSSLVNVKKLDDIPPPFHREYRYAPAPAEVIPPLGESHLLHLFQNPSCAKEDSVCIDRFPKKLRAKLRCSGGVNPGWGLQLIEGWHWRKIWLLGYIFFALGSLLIGVLFSVYEHSIADAFTIASYVITFGAVSVGSLQALLVM